MLNAGGEPVRGPGFLNKVHLPRLNLEVLPEGLILNMAYYRSCCFAPLVHFLNDFFIGMVLGDF